jgi:hypothetical protein
MAKDMLAEQRNSLTMAVSVSGRPWPPNSVGAEMPTQLLAELAGLAQHRFDDIGRGLGEARQIAEAVEMEDVVQQEQGIVHGGFIDRHFSSPGWVPRIVAGACGERTGCRRGRPCRPTSAPFCGKAPPPAIMAAPVYIGVKDGKSAVASGGFGGARG